MASAVYPKAKELFMGGNLDLVNDTIKAILVDTADYTYNSGHDFLDDVAAVAIVGEKQK